MAVSVDNELVLFSGTTGEVVKRATGTGQVRVAGGVFGVIPADAIDVVADYGADPTGATNNATQFQSALTAAATAKLPLYIPPGSYRIQTQLDVPTNSRILGYGAKLLCYDTNLGNSSGTRAVLSLRDATDIQVSGLEIDGRKASFGTTEFKSGITMVNSARMTLRDLYLHDCKGEGFLAMAENHDGTDRNYDVLAENVRCWANHRNGAYFGDVTRARVIASSFRLTVGTAPQSGFDVEPDHINDYVQDVVFLGCDFSDNGPSYGGLGAWVTFKQGSTRQFGVKFLGCTFARNGVMGLGTYHSYDLTVDGCTFDANELRGFQAYYESNRLKIVNCRFVNNAQSAIVIAQNSAYTSTDVKIIGNDIAPASGNRGVEVPDSGGVLNGLVVSHNTIVGGSYGLKTLSTTTKVRAVGNEFRSQTTAATDLQDDTTTRRLAANQGLADYPVISGGGGGGAVLPQSIHLFIDGNATQTQTNIPSGVTEFINARYRRRAVLTNATDARLVIFQGSASNSGSELRAQYTTDLTGASGWTYLDNSAGPSVALGTGTNAQIVGSWVTIDSGAKGDVLVRAVTINGSGAISPTFWSVELQVR